MNNDRIANFDQLVLDIAKHIDGQWKHTQYDNFLVLFLLHVNNGLLSVQASVTVMSDLSIVVCQSGVKIDSRKFLWILGNDVKLDCWSKLSPMLSHLSAGDPIVKSADEKIADICSILKCLCEDEYGEQIHLAESDKTDDEAKRYRVINFVVQQLTLLLQSQKKYTTDFMRWAFQIFSLSPTAYNCLRDSNLILPHPTYLRTLSKCFTVEPGTECNAHVAYLTEKAKLLQEHELYVTLLLDEIYVNPKISYKAGCVDGFAVNCDLSQATTVQAFMISSVLSSQKDIAALVPIKNLTALYLKELTSKVISMVELTNTEN
jgi:hypothetical protein